LKESCLYTLSIVQFFFFFKKHLETETDPSLRNVLKKIGRWTGHEHDSFKKSKLSRQNVFLLHLCRSRGSSVSIVSDYGLDDRAIGVRSPSEAKDFSSTLCVQTCSGAHPASCTMGTGDPFPGGKARPGRDADHLPLSSVEVENE
jgi:hypothetical protein